MSGGPPLSSILWAEGWQLSILGHSVPMGSALMPSASGLEDFQLSQDIWIANIKLRAEVQSSHITCGLSVMHTLDLHEHIQQLMKKLEIQPWAVVLGPGCSEPHSSELWMLIPKSTGLWECWCSLHPLWSGFSCLVCPSISDPLTVNYSVMLRIDMNKWFSTSM